MFADCDCWIVEKALLESPNRELYEMWIEQGWLHKCPGQVFNPDYAMNALMAKHKQGLNLYAFGYDPAQSPQPINTLKAWLQSLFTSQGMGGHLEYLLLGMEYDSEQNRFFFTSDTPLLYLSNSPLWPWGFQNCKVEESASELRHIRKTTQNTKVDMIHALVDAIWLFDLSEGQVQE